MIPSGQVCVFVSEFQVRQLVEINRSLLRHSSLPPHLGLETGRAEKSEVGTSSVYLEFTTVWV